MSLPVLVFQSTSSGWDGKVPEARDLLGGNSAVKTAQYWRSMNSNLTCGLFFNWIIFGRNWEDSLIQKAYDILNCNSF